MKKALSIFLVLSIVFVAAAPSMAAPERMTYGDGEMDGRLAADEQHSSLGWGAGGYAGGLLLGFIGGGVVIAGTRFIDPDIPGGKIYQIQDYPSEYRAGFREGYVAEAQSKNTRSAAIGAGLGMATLLAIILTTQ